MAESTSTLYRKIAEVVAEVEEVAKRGHNDHFNYDYATAEDILRALRGPLSARHIVLIPSLQGIEERPYKTSRGNESVITTVQVAFTFVDGESGERHEASWAGEGDDPADKGLGKAYTNAVKTYLRIAFLLPQGDDPEADSSADQRGAERESSGQRSSRGGGNASDKQITLVRKLMTEQRLSQAQARALLGEYGVTVGEDESPRDACARLRWPGVSKLIDRLKEQPFRTGESDIPSDAGEFEHPVEDGEPLFDPSVPA